MATTHGPKKIKLTKMETKHNGTINNSCSHKNSVVVMSFMKEGHEQVRASTRDRELMLVDTEVLENNILYLLLGTHRQEAFIGNQYCMI
jgi:hypothetical protein